MNRFLAAMLVLLLPACAPEPMRHAWETDPIESRIGTHVIPNFGDDPARFSSEISEAGIRTALKSVDWESGFHQVIVVTAPGVSMEVGGSLDPDHGLSAVYRNRHERTELITRDAPRSIAELEAILLAFAKNDDSWRKIRAFD
jgi:hypothetical protein